MAVQYLFSGNRVVVVDAPVGSGKSAINYTILKSLGNAPAIYLTAQKSLQDQIEADDFPDVKIIKGKNAYICQKMLLDNMTVECDFQDESQETCYNVKRWKYSPSHGFDLLCDNIRRSIKLPRSERIRLSGFSSESEIDFLMEALSVQRTGVDKKTAFVRAVGCNLAPVECPVKSSRLFAKYARIVVANPDVFYNLNQFTGIFDIRKYMVVDEAHRLEDAVQRIFRMKIPIGPIKDAFGIDFLSFPLKKIGDFYILTKDSVAFIRGKLLPLMAVCDTLNKLTDILHIHNLETMESSGILKTSFFGKDGDSVLKNTLAKCVSKYNGRSFCIFSVACSAFLGQPLTKTIGAINHEYAKFEPLRDEIRRMFESSCRSHGCEPYFNCDEFLTNSLEKFIRRRHNIHSISSFGMRHIKSSEKGYGASISSAVNFLLNNYGVFEKICSIPHVVGDRFSDGMFIVHMTKIDADRLRKDAEFSAFVSQDDTGIYDMMEIIPLNTGGILQKLFFKPSVEKIILSSGTWPDYEGTLKTYGFRTDGVLKVKAESVFNPDNRTIFICTNPEWTDFCEKTKDGSGYVYETEAGKMKFCRELRSLIDYIREIHGNCNIVAHTFSFKISQIIAEYIPGADEKFLIHLPRASDEYVNKLNGFRYKRLSKEFLVTEFKNNPDSGLTLVSPSVGEGLDFKYGICRAQIIVKAPIPYLGDPYTVSRFRGIPEINLQADRMFLDRRCAIDLNQAYGRNVRAPDDWGETYIMDLALTKRLAKAFGIHTPGIPQDVPGNMGKLDLSYIAEGIQIVRDRYGRKMFYWPKIGGR